MDVKPHHIKPDGPAAMSPASGSGHGPAPVRAAGSATASAPRPAQRLGERPVVRDQARHLPGVVLDLPPQGRDLRGVLRPVPLVLRGQLPQGSPQLPFQRGHRGPSLARQRFKAGRPPTVQGGLLNVPAGSTTNRSPSISRSSSPEVVSSIAVSVSRACSMSTVNAASVSTFHSMPVYSKRIAAQFPPQMPTRRLRPATRGQSHARSSIPRIRPAAAVSV